MLLLPTLSTLIFGLSATTAFHHTGVVSFHYTSTSPSTRYAIVSSLHASSSPNNDHKQDAPTFDPSSPSPSSFSHPIVGRRTFHKNLANTIAASTAALLTTTTIPTLPSNAVDDATAAPPAFTLYKDAPCAFQFKFPTSWEQSEQTLPDRRRIVFFIDPKSGAEDKNLIFVAYTPIRDDFTSLASFGSVDQIAEQTILPKGTLAGEKTDNKMLSADSKGGAYFFDYVSQSAGQPKRHFRTIFTLAPGATGGAGSVLVAITAQTLESNYAELKPLFDDVVKSYGKLK